MSEQVELDMHRSIDELGKFSVTLKIDSEISMTSADTSALLSEIMIGVTEACFSKGADMIGHVKACAYNAGDESRMCSANLTSFKNGVKINDMMLGSHLLTGGYVMLHVILHGLWDTEVRKISLTIINEIMTARHIGYRVMRDFFESEKRVKT